MNYSKHAIFVTIIYTCLISFPFAQHLSHITFESLLEEKYNKATRKPLLVYRKRTFKAKHTRLSYYNQNHVNNIITVKTQLQQNHVNIKIKVKNRNIAILTISASKCFNYLIYVPKTPLRNLSLSHGFDKKTMTLYSSLLLIGFFLHFLLKMIRK